MTAVRKQRYHATESKYKGGAQDMFVTYDLEQKTRGGGTATYPKVKRVYIAGDVKNWKLGRWRKKSGRETYGVRVIYEQSRKGYRREGFEARRGNTEYEVRPAAVPPTAQEFTQIVEVPEEAENVHFYMNKKKLPEKYQTALQDVR